MKSAREEFEKQFTRVRDLRNGKSDGADPVKEIKLQAERRIKEDAEHKQAPTITTRAEIYEQLGDYVKAKKDLIVACDSKQLFACDQLEKFNADEDRGRNWKYFSTNQNQSKIFYDKSRVTKSKGTVNTWIRFEDDPKTYNLRYITLDCKNRTLSFSEDKKNWDFTSISPDSIYQALYKEVCKSK